ncbi:MAG: T9SS type A sorting domain-containing protein [Bacteroidota bacterium]
MERTGALDGGSYSSSPGDRRTFSNTGPFFFQPGDTQEVTVGVIAGLGADRFSSISVMKANDAAAQSWYDGLLQFPKPPASPIAVASELDGKVIIEWGSNITRVKETEAQVSQPGDYEFEGYNVYQLPKADAPLSSSKLLATYDVVNRFAVILSTVYDPILGVYLTKPIQFGTNSGIQRYFVFDWDYINDVALDSSHEYLLAITAYSHTASTGFPAALESSPFVVTVRSELPPGITPVVSFGDTLPLSKSGISDGSALVTVVSPTRLTGHSYKITFDSSGAWDLIDVSGGAVPGTGSVRVANTAVLECIKDQSGGPASPIADGMQIRVFSAPNGVRDFLHVRNPAGNIVPPSYSGFSALGNQGFPCVSGADTLSGGGPSIGDYGGSGSDRWGIHTGGTGTGGDATYSGRWLPRVMRSSPYSGTSNFQRFVPFDYELRFVDTSTVKPKAYSAFTDGRVITVPFEIWNTGIGTPNDPSDDIRMIPWVNDQDVDGKFNLEKLDHSVSGADDDPYTDWIYWMDPNPKSTGSAGYDAFAADPFYDGGGAVTGTGDEVMARVVLVAVNGGSVSASDWPANVISLMPKTGNVFRIISTKPHSRLDAYMFDTAPYKATTGANSVQEIVYSFHLSQNYPNPFNPTTRIEYSVAHRGRVTLKIIDILGREVAVLVNEEKSAGRYSVAWNASKIASGVYFYRLESGGFVETKKLVFLK